MKASAVPETALHNPVPVRTQFSHNRFLFISAVDIDVGINWLYLLKLKTRPFHPIDVVVDPTGWYIVFANSTQGSASMRQCFSQLNNAIFALPFILRSIQLSWLSWHMLKEIVEIIYCYGPSHSGSSSIIL